MLSSLLLSTLLVTAPGPTPLPISRAELLSPFDSEMTVSWHETATDGSTTYPTAALTLYGDLMRQPAKVAAWNTAPTPVPTMGMETLFSGSDLLVSDTPTPGVSTPTPTPLLSEPCIGASCRVPLPSDITNWSSVIRYRIGIVVNVQDMEAITWPTPNDGMMFEMLRNIRDGMQSLHAMFLRDAGIDLKVEHIAFFAFHFPNDDGWFNQSVQASKFWAANITTHHPVRVLLRLSVDQTGRSNLNGPCGDNAIVPIPIIYANWPWTQAAYDDEWRAREGVLAVPAMELGHQLLGVDHTQCYRDADGQPLEYCHQGGCWTGDLVCPANEDQSVMGYCWEICNSPTAPGDGPLAPPNPSPWPALRLCPQPPQENAMCLLARRNALGFAPSCFPYDEGYVVYQLPTSWADADGDGYPDSMDNCPNKANPEQVNRNINDGRGDDCSFCAIDDPKRTSTAWILAIPLIVLMIRRRTN